MNIVIIPGGFTISGDSIMNSYSPALMASIEVPELLHPTKLVITPGLSYKDGEPQIITFDLTSEPNDQLPPVAASIEDLPTSIQASENIQIAIDLPLPSEVNYDGDSFILELPFSVKNTDITGDQPVALACLLIDEFGQIVATHVCDDIMPDFVGPNQTVSVNASFQLPADSVFGPRKFYLSIINNSVDKTYIVPLPELINCSQAAEMPSDIYLGSDHNVISDTSITIPGTVSGSLKNTGNREEDEAHRIEFLGKAGQAISISISINTSPKSSKGWWGLIVTDPSGKQSFITYGWDDEDSWLSNISYIPLYCDGAYHLYITYDSSAFWDSEENFGSYNLTINYK
jgi:hypothetical protein